MKATGDTKSGAWKGPQPPLCWPWWRKLLAASIAVPTAIVIVFAIYVALVRWVGPLNMVSFRLNAQLSGGEIRIAIADIAPFDWDEVCVLGSYRQLPHDVPLEQHPHWSMDDSTAGLAFFNDGQLISASEIAPLLGGTCARRAAVLERVPSNISSGGRISLRLTTP